MNNKKCPLPWRAMLIDIYGNVNVCCFNNTLLGNVGQSSVEKIWNNEKYQNIRRKLKENDFSCGCSEQCPYVIEFRGGQHK